MERLVSFLWTEQFLAGEGPNPLIAACRLTVELDGPHNFAVHLKDDGSLLSLTVVP
jgi:hypothetical protein